jgi:hypothetical protein
VAGRRVTRSRWLALLAGLRDSTLAMLLKLVSETYKRITLRNEENSCSIVRMPLKDEMLQMCRLHHKTKENSCTVVVVPRHKAYIGK